MRASIVNEDAAHRLGGSGEKVCAIFPRGLIVAAEPQPGLVDQRRCLQRLTGTFARHLLRGQLAQLLVNEWEQFIRGVRVALLQSLKDDGEFSSRNKA